MQHSCFFIVATAVNAATYITIDGIRYVYNSTKTYVSVASVKSPSVYVGDVVIPEIITNTSGKVISVKAVKSSVFGDCTDVTSVTLPSSVTLSVTMHSKAIRRLRKFTVVVQILLKSRRDTLMVMKSIQSSMILTIPAEYCMCRQAQ